ncbi:MAG: hypothetical protein HQM03_12060 [Magnetococcales bacterium]|nr:hypothetical protein [Magnetococcales bacterium]
MITLNNNTLIKIIFTIACLIFSNPLFAATTPIPEINPKSAGSATFYDVGSTIILNGSKSTSTLPSANISYLWTCSNCAALGLPPVSNTNSIFSFVIPQIPATESTLIFDLTTNDGSQPNTASIPILVRTNQPVAILSTVTVIQIPVEIIVQQGVRITLDASPSLYVPGTLKTSLWTVSPQNAQITINNVNALSTFADIGKQVPVGKYEFKETIIDTLGRTSSVTLTVQIVAANQLPPTVASVTLTNQTGNIINTSAPQNTVITLTPVDVKDDHINAAGLRYEWTQDASDPYRIPYWSTATTVPVITFTTPTLSPYITSTKLHLTLKVTDPADFFTEKSVIVNISNTTAPPSAAASADLTTAFEGETITLNGSGSSDPNGGTILSYLWSLPGFPNVILSDTKTANPTFVAPRVPVNGTSIDFTLAVTNNNLLTNNPLPLRIIINKSSANISNCSDTAFATIHAADRAGSPICIKDPSAEAKLVELVPKHPSLLISTTSQAPQNIEFGMLALRLKTRKVGDLVTLNLQFDRPIPDNLTLGAVKKLHGLL